MLKLHSVNKTAITAHHFVTVLYRPYPLAVFGWLVSHKVQSNQDARPVVQRTSPLLLFFSYLPLDRTLPARPLSNLPGLTLSAWRGVGISDSLDPGFLFALLF